MNFVTKTKQETNKKSSYGIPSLLSMLGSSANASAEIINAELEAISAALDRSQATIEFDTSGKILTANQNFLTTAGYQLEEIVGQHHRMFVDYDYSRSKEYQDFWKQLAGGEFVSGEFARVDKDGNRVWLNASYNPIKDDEGVVRKIIKFASDITDAKTLSANHKGQIDAVNRAQAVIEFSPDSTILHANENFLAVTGYSLDEIVGKQHRIFVDEECVASLEYKQFWETLRNGEYLSNQYQRYAKDGSVFWIQASYNPIFSADGTLMKVVKFATDITQQKLQSSQDHSLVEAINRAQAVIHFDLFGNILDANDNFCSTMGYSKSEIIGKNHSMFVDVEYVGSKDYVKFWDDLRRGEFQSAEYKRFGRGGKPVWLRATYNPVFGPSGELKNIVKFAQDITAEMEIRQEIKLLSLVANETDNAVLITDKHGITEYVNPGFTKMTGFSEAQIKGKKPGNLLQGDNTDEATKLEIKQKLSQQVPFYIEILNYSDKGAPYWISLSINPVFDEDGDLSRYVSINADITETKMKALEFNIRMNAIERANSVVEWSDDGKVVRANENAVQLFGTDDLNELSKLLKLEEILEEADLKSLQDGNSFIRDVKLHGENSGSVYLSSVFTAIHSEVNNNNSIVMYATDTTERRESVARANQLMESVLGEIMGISQEISSVSMQTKLLSLNAGVEAARAGEAGRGFSIVAQEVRDLADKTSKSMAKMDSLLNETREQITELSKTS